MRALLAGLLLALSPPVARACDTALLLMIDVSNSIDVAEYRLQVDGMADALDDPAVIEALLQGGTALSVVQWSGPDRQQITLPWTEIRSILDVIAFRDRARAMERAFVMSGTAPGDALAFGLDHMGAAPACKRQVIDISGDGTPNAGRDVRGISRAAERQGVTINAIAIEGLGLAISTFYRRQVITRDGFVMTARGYRDYPDAIRRKILRELSRVMG